MVAHQWKLGQSKSWLQKREERKNKTGKAPSPKGGFFSERAIRFSNLQNKNIPKNYPELEI